ncbi:MAG: metallophosphoesterase [Pyrobaculum sp.]
MAGRRALFITSVALAALTAVGGVVSLDTKISVLNVGLGRKVLFISDLHIHRRERYELPEADLVLIGGDAYDEWTPSLDVVVDVLRAVRGPKVAVLGNHEHWARRRFPLREGVRALEDAGVHVLRDDWVDVGGLRVYGLDWREDPTAYPPVRGADVVLVHSPDAFQTAVEGLYLAGHTHGGQICLPGNVPLYTNSRFGYTWGWYKKSGASMYVSRGLGEMLPRVYCDREVVLLY